MLHATDNAKSQEALAKSQDDEDDTAAEATHQSIVVQTEKQPHTAIKQIFKFLNATCIFDDDLGSWAFSDTVDADTMVALWEFNWEQITGRSDIETIAPHMLPTRSRC